MNEELKEKLIHYLDVLEKGAQKGADFVVEQAPETVRQWVTYSLVSEAACVVAFSLCIAVIIAAYVVVWRETAKFRDSMDKHAARGFSGAVLAVICGVLFMAGLLPHAQKALMIWLAPNVFIIKELAELVK